ncbi:MAG: hypothetical protein ACREC9_06850 [Methylocella sp.]
MRDFVLFIASLAGAAILTALAIMIRPESPLWKFVLWGGIGIFIACACVLLIDYNRANEPKVLLGGLGIGIALVIGCAIALVFRNPSPIAAAPEVQTPPAYTGKIEAEKVDVLLSAKKHEAARIIEIGDSGAQFLFTGAEGAPLFQFAENYNLIIESIDRKVKVSTQIRDQTRKMVAELIRNEWKVAPPPKTWDRNYNRSALEVKDEGGNVVLQVRALPDRIQIQGEWWQDESRGVRFVSNPNGAGGLIVIFGTGFGPEQAPMIQPIFVYPSEMHMGELRQ